jgi:serine/threonine protein phosphatase 1
VPGRHRIYVIGDIHGRSDLLGRMRELIARDLGEHPPQEKTLTVLLGDYVDRGPDSQAVVRQLVAEPFPTPLIPLRGNHEEMLLDFLDDPETGATWRQNGGLETLHSYGLDVRPMRAGGGYSQAAERFRERLPAEHLQFIKDCRFVLSVGDYFFCHAGVRPGVPLEEQHQNDLVWIREPFLSSRKDFGRVVVHGHTPVMEPDVRHNRINIDTGAYVTGRLTCLVLEGEMQHFLSTGPGAAAERRGPIRR